LFPWAWLIRTVGLTKMKTFLALLALCLPAVLCGAVPSRYYYEQANEPRFDEIKLGMAIADVNKICGGRSFPPFETVRGGFAFAVDEQRSGILALPWHIDLKQTVDFFTSKKRVLVVFYKEGKAHGLMLFDFAKGEWENRSRPKDTDEKKEPNQSTQRNAGSRPSSDDSPVSETSSSLGPRG
jgi:hypothetical protein